MADILYNHYSSIVSMECFINGWHDCFFEIYFTIDRTSFLRELEFLENLLFHNSIILIFSIIFQVNNALSLVVLNFHVCQLITIINMQDNHCLTFRHFLIVKRLKSVTHCDLLLMFMNRFCCNMLLRMINNL